MEQWEALKQQLNYLHQTELLGQLSRLKKRWDGRTQGFYRPAWIFEAHPLHCKTELSVRLRGNPTFMGRFYMQPIVQIRENNTW